MNSPLYLIKQTAISNIKTNPEIFWDAIKCNPLSADAPFAFLKEDFKEKTQFYFDFEFSMDGYKNPEQSDFDNTVRLYKALRDVPRNVLFSESFLFSFLFNYGYSYFHWRWIPVYKDEANRALSHILFLRNSRRAITVNAIGHLLFRAFMLIDDDLEGIQKYALLKKAYKYRNCFTIDYYSYADNKKVYRAFVKCVIAQGEKGRPLINSQVQKLCSHLSMIQGVSLCETLDENEIFTLLTEYADTL